MLMDAVWMIFSLSFVSAIRPLLSLLEFVAIIPPPYSLPWIIYLVFPLIWIVILSSFSVYDTKKLTHFTDEILRLILGSFVSSMCLAGLLYLSYRDVSRLLFVVFIGLVIFGSITWRIIARYLAKAIFRGGQATRNVLILGNSSSMLEELDENFKNQANQEFSFIFLPFETLQKTKEENEDFSENVLNTIVREKIDDIILAFSDDINTSISFLVGKLHRFAVRVWVIPDYFQLTINRANYGTIAGLPLLELPAPAISERQRIIKRAFDLALSIMVSPLALPIMLVIAIIVKNELPGPVIFQQKRIGENGKVFKMYKFRTMVENAE